MRRSIRWPPTLAGGRLVLTPDPEADNPDPTIELNQVIALACLDCTNANPFQSGLGVEDPTFTGQRPVDKARIRGRIQERFKGLERDHRARLVDVKFEAAGAELTARITYEDLESGTRQSMELALD